jgi:hypothetical protein
MASLLAGAGISAITGLIGGGKQASAIKQAANIESTAATQAAANDKTATDNSLNFTKDVYGNTVNSEAPYQQAGTGALAQLAAGTATGGEFNSTPTAQQVLAQDPGYDFNLQQGQQALERAEAAGGSVGSGGALKAGVQFASDYANNEYNNAYNRYVTTRQDNYNNLAGLANAGLSANSTLAGAGTAAASNVANTTLTGTNNQNNEATSAASAQAGGITGAANAQASSLSNVGNLATLAGLQQNLNSSGYKAPSNAGNYADGSLEE